MEEPLFSRLFSAENDDFLRGVSRYSLPASPKTSSRGGSEDRRFQSRKSLATTAGLLLRWGLILVGNAEIVKFMRPFSGVVHADSLGALYFFIFNFDSAIFDPKPRFFPGRQTIYFVIYF